MALLICLVCSWECICAIELLMGSCSDRCGRFFLVNVGVIKVI